MTKRGEEFAQLVHQVLVMEKRYDMEEVAKKCGVSYDTFYARVSNRVLFSIEEIRLLIRAAPDARFVGYLLANTPFVAAERADLDGLIDEPLESIRRTSVHMVIDASAVAHAIELAIADKRIDHREAQVINNEIDEAERALATVREHVQTFSKQNLTG